MFAYPHVISCVFCGLFFYLYLCWTGSWSCCEVLYVDFFALFLITCVGLKEVGLKERACHVHWSDDHFLGLSHWAGSNDEETEPLILNQKPLWLIVLVWKRFTWDFMCFLLAVVVPLYPVIPVQFMNHLQWHEVMLERKKVKLCKTFPLRESWFRGHLMSNRSMEL